MHGSCIYDLLTEKKEYSLFYPTEYFMEASMVCFVIFLLVQKKVFSKIKYENTCKTLVKTAASVLASKT